MPFCRSAAVIHCGKLLLITRSDAVFFRSHSNCRLGIFCPRPFSVEPRLRALVPHSRGTDAYLGRDCDQRLLPL
jgi:hypothetical protein